MKRLDPRMLERIVREVVREVEGRKSADTTQTHTRQVMQTLEAGSACERPPLPLHNVERAVVPQQLEQLVTLTNSQIAVGRTGCRFPTDLYLRLREGHADAKDAVHTEVPEVWAEQHGLLSLKTQCKDRHEYLLYPNHGRRLDDASKQALLARAEPGADVQLILGDGLSPNAILVNGSECLSAMKTALSGAGWKTGTPLFVKFARIGVADEIGMLLKARATVILVGERPGLGTGDSLSFYLAVNPKLDQDNAEKNCISNVRPIGIKPSEAAAQSVTILKRSFEHGRGGVGLGVGYGRQ